MEGVASSLAVQMGKSAAQNLMKTLLTITYTTNDGDQTIQFGRPETQEEVRKMYQLRYKIYVAHKRYIPMSWCSDGLEIDQSDHAGACHYFIAQCAAQMVGTVRLIHEQPLPMEAYWQYDKPDDLREMRLDEPVEVSRLIADHSSGVSIPPSLIPLGLIHCATHFILAQGIRVAYATLQERMVRHMEGWGLPVRRLEAVRYVAGRDDPLKDYYANPAEPVCPTCFLSGEVSRFFDQLLEQGLVFKQLTAAHYRYRPPNRQ
jgi:N-acyl-L-homoserine lactone synthetase